MTPRPRKSGTKVEAPDDTGAPLEAPAGGDAPDLTVGSSPALAAAAGDGEAAARDDFVAVRVLEAAMVLPNPNPFLVLEEIAPPNRRLTIPIGFAEGTAIGFVLRGRPTPKPLTHELFVDVVGRLGGWVEVARITGYSQGAFYAEIVIEGPGAEHVVACRPSDAVALALRQGASARVVVDSALFAQLGTDGSAAG